MDENELSHKIIGAAIEVHRNLGPGLLESIYEEALTIELHQQGIVYERQKLVPVIYKGMRLETSFRVDLMVNNCVIVELKSVERLTPVHEAQVMTYMKLTGCKLALLMNFNVVKMVNGIQRMVLGLPEPTIPYLRKRPRQIE
jgi:GxxExxY protein